MAELRIGHGYDAHRLTEGRRLVLGGVEVPFERGLAGHSDADVLVHAIMDAILGALGMGDIGAFFPDTAPEWKDADSMILLGRVVELAVRRGYRLCNLDATIIAQLPRLSPYTAAMRENIAGSFDVGVERVSVKATTEEGLGFTGNGEGIAAHCVLLLDST